MSWRDPSSYTFIFDDGTEIDCEGLIGIFSFDCGLNSVYNELGVKSLESYCSLTREEYLKELDEWKEEMPASLRTEECINGYPEKRKYFDAAEGFEMIRKLKKYFTNAGMKMEEDFNFIQKLISGNSEFILHAEMDYDIDELREPEYWFHTYQYSKRVYENSGGYWHYSGHDRDINYSRKEIQHVNLLVEFLTQLEMEFEKQAEKKSGWYLSVFVPY